MPLAKGKSQAVISRNIAELVRSGRDPKVAAAIAYKAAGKDAEPDERTSLVEQFKSFADMFLRFLREEEDEPEHQGEDGDASAMVVKRAHDEALIAFDRAPDSAREYDDNGYLHVAETNISKANICPYYGREIPGADKLGLDPERQYMLLRDPGELARAADTFKGLPLLWRHQPVAADDHPSDIVIGSIGDDVRFDYPYLKASLHIWPKYATDAIENEIKKELSCGYQYTPDPTPGEYEGQPYDIVMRNIVGNHVALVETGRAGSDVMVGDEHPEGSQMKKGLRAAALLLKQKLGLDTSIDDVVLALDAASLEPNASVPATKKAKDEKDDDDEDEDKKKKKEAEDDDDNDAVEAAETVAEAVSEAVSEAVAEVKEDDEDDEDDKPASDKRRARDSKRRARDADPDDRPVSKKAMDAALAAERSRMMQNARDLRAAEAAVRPYVGELAMDHDSAADVYRTALKMLGVAGVEKIHPSAYPALLAAQPRGPRTVPVIATDAAAVAGFAERYPAAAKIKLL